ncbi:MAG TPA: hypothetical protein VEF76_03010 [Patescibacteria group bacterium]|nr:hypothetical protein [Patescibacteria group bacterium]
MGAFVVQAAPQPEDLPPAMRAEIEKRINGAGFVPVTQIVQETYIKEVIDLAVNISKARFEKDALKRLKDLVEILDTFEVRNHVCHPNRAFPAFFWYRMAALATDPCIEQLRLRKVTDAVHCAVEGRLTPPPEGWLQQQPWLIPNNLPTTFDHQLTGLIARNAEAADLRKRLRNARNSLIAIVGPGGTGKTALCLEVLRDCVHDVQTLEWADQIVYVTAKTEHLTSRGVEAIADPIASLSSVKSAISGALYGYDPSAEDIQIVDFEQACREMHERRILLCVDNLETILRTHPQEFEEFSQTLPEKWRVVVTSRVSVDGATVLSLGPIGQDGANKLVRDYSSLRGTGRLEEAQIQRLTEVTDRNPLAIRLVIDAYAAGIELAKALAQTRDRIVDFSYTSLLDHLPPNSIKILECLFGSSGPLSRGQIGHLLEINPDEVAEAINSLLRTSLVTRETGNSTERYALSSSVRDLLIRTPRDPEIRKRVYSRLQDQHRMLQELEQRGTRDCLSDTFVAGDTADHIRAALVKIRPSLLGRTSRSEQLSSLADVRRALEFDPSSSVLHRCEGILLELLGDRYGALEAFGRAVSGPFPDSCARLRLAEVLKEEKDYNAAINQARPLVEATLLTDIDISIANKARLIKAYWLPILWLGMHDKVLEETASWREMQDLRPSYVALRVSALRKIFETETLQSVLADTVHDLVSTLKESFRVDGYVSLVVHETFKTLEELEDLTRKKLLSSDALRDIANLLDQHLVEMCAVSRDNSITDKNVVALIENFRNAYLENNPLRAQRWEAIVRPEGLHDKLKKAGYEPANVTYKADHGNHVFARSIDGSRDFFVRVSATELTSAEFQGLKLGQTLLVLPSGDPPENGRAWPAKHAMVS